MAFVLLLNVPPDDGRILHTLNRLTWGPRPGDVERVRAQGLEAWLETQLHPSRIHDTHLEGRMASLQTAGLSSAELRRGYEVPREAKKEFKARQAALGDDPSEDDRRAARREFYLELAPRMSGRPQEVIEELQQAKLLRAVYSERQLADVLADFWFNHFNVDAGKGRDRYLVAEYEREAIRPHALGRFEDLLRATAESPAMLVYLDNWVSAAPGTDVALLRRGYVEAAGRRGAGRARFGFRRPALDAAADRGQPGEAPRTLGLNENYAREIMELHTLGVDGGYTQKDVTEVARCFTGWTVRGLRADGQAPEFAFVPAMHDGGEKTVLGRRIAGGGKDEGDRVITLLATHPSTARFISTKLARRFVADEPPASLVQRMTDTFRETDGQIAAVVRTMVLSPEFAAPELRGAKTKTPLEFAVSALRATGADLLGAREVASRLEAMGMPLYRQPPPTGYKDTADAWASSASLVARLSFALDLAGNRLGGTRVDAGALASLAGPASAGGPDAGLLLGSPEFQRR
jgi:uncharacterized protein (DUF1800 family)